MGNDGCDEFTLPGSNVESINRRIVNRIRAAQIDIVDFALLVRLHLEAFRLSSMKHKNPNISLQPLLFVLSR
jgi:hypothetical protein